MKYLSRICKLSFVSKVSFFKASCFINRIHALLLLLLVLLCSFSPIFCSKDDSSSSLNKTNVSSNANNSDQKNREQPSNALPLEDIRRALPDVEYSSTLRPLVTEDLNFFITEEVELEPLLTEYDQSFEFNYSAKNLPESWSIDILTGIIRGSANNAGRYDITVAIISTVNTQAIKLIPFSLEIIELPIPSLNYPELGSSLFIYPDQSMSFVPNLNYLNPTELNSDISYIYRANNLPLGWSIDPQTGVISVTSTPKGDHAFTIIIEGTGNTEGAQTIAVSVSSFYALPSVSYAGLGSSTFIAHQQLSYRPSLSHSVPQNFHSQVSYIYSANNLPSGWSIDTQTGIIDVSSTPGGEYDFTITIEGTGNTKGTQTIAVSVSSFYELPTISYANAGNLELYPDENVDLRPIVSHSVSQNLQSYISYVYSANNLPSGWSIDTEIGRIRASNTPRGNYSFTITIEGTGNTRGTQTIAVSVSSFYGLPTISYANLNNLQLFPGQTFQFTPSITHSVPQNLRSQISYVYSSTNLPSGWSLDRNTGLINIRSTSNGNHNFSINIRGTSNTRGEYQLSFSVNARNISYTNTKQMIGVKQRIRNIVPNVNRNSISGLIFSARNLPPGISINSNTGVVSGQLTELSSSTSQINVSYNGEIVHTQNLDFTILYDLIPNYSQRNVPTNQELVLFVGEGLTSQKKDNLCRELSLYYHSTRVASTCTKTHDKIIVKANRDLTRNRTYTLKHSISGTNHNLLSFTTSNATYHKRGQIVRIYNPLTPHENSYVYNKSNYDNIRSFIKLYKKERSTWKSQFNTARRLGIDTGISRRDFNFFTSLMDRVLNSPIGTLLLNDSISGSIRYSVAFSKIIYTSIDQNGQLVQVSGLIAYPNNINTSVPLISDQHGTIFSNTDAPSNSLQTCDEFSYRTRRLPVLKTKIIRSYTLNCDLITNSSDQHKLTIGSLSLLAYKGGFVVAPDYLGYGTTSRYNHTYLHAETTGASVIDAMRAVRQAVRTNHRAISGNIRLSNNNLVGYSEGGFATIAARQMAEERYSSELNVSQSKVIAGAGPYAAEKSLREYYLPRNGSLNSITGSLLRFAFPTLNSIYGVSISNNDIFNPTGSSATFKTSFIQNYNSQSNIAYRLFKKYILLNNVYQWYPRSGSIHLFHGINDDIVPILNTNTAFNYFTHSSNPNRSNITRNTSCTSSSAHFNCYISYLSDVVGRITFNQ